MKISKLAVFITAFCLLICLAGVPKALAAGYDDLDLALRELSDYLNRRIPKDSKVVFLNVKSDWPEFSEYIISSLIENAVNDEVFTVVDRQQLDLIRAELNFQWSGEVSDVSAQEIGQMLGAQTIVSGMVTEVGSEYRIQVRAISVQTAALQGLTSKNIDRKGQLVSALTTAPAAAAAKSAKKEEDARKKEADARKRQADSENFMKNSGFNISGWMGYIFDRKQSLLSGGVDLELNFLRYIGLETGFIIFQDEDKPQFDERTTQSTDEKPPEQIKTQTVLQIPLLARLTLPISEYYISVYGGLGLNLYPFGPAGPASIQTSPKYSLIVGGDLGFTLLNMQLFMGYQFNRDLSETAYEYSFNKVSKDFNYVGQRSMITMGLKFFLPFRKS